MLVPPSTCETEYHALTQAVKKSVWIVRIMKESDLYLAKTPTIHLDDQSASRWATSSNLAGIRAKHINIHIHFIFDLLALPMVSVEHTSIQDNDADVVKKALDGTNMNRVSFHARVFVLRASGGVLNSGIEHGFLFSIEIWRLKILVLLLVVLLSDKLAQSRFFGTVLAHFCLHKILILKISYIGILEFCILEI